MSVHGIRRKPPAEDDVLGQKLRDEARSLFLQQKSKALLTNDQLKTVLQVLEEHATPPVLEDVRMIGYDDYKKVRDLIPDKAKEMLSATTFLKLQCSDPYGRVRVSQLFHYVMRKTWLQQSRIGLSLYDQTGQGYLSEKDLEVYLSELVPTLPEVSKLEPSFLAFYLCTAVRRFLFYLDPLRQGRVKIAHILASGFLDDLLELRNSEGLGGAGSSKAARNWFSAESARSVYAQYLSLDTDMDGLLSEGEVQKFGSGQLTKVFVDRLFQESMTFNGKMDYKAFVDLVLAYEDKKEPAALRYFFRVLDVRQRGYIDAFVINYFFREIQKLLEEQDHEVVTFEDVKDEIFDMVRPKDPLKITLNDLIDSSQGDTVVEILTDLSGFLAYENREMLATEDDSDEESDSDTSPRAAEAPI